MSTDGTISLKRNHAYYDQVQLQLYVTSANWCDFCVYTTKGIAIESIYPDIEWKVRNLPKLQYFYDNILLPEILLPRMNQVMYYNVLFLYICTHRDTWTVPYLIFPL